MGPCLPRLGGRAPGVTNRQTHTRGGHGAGVRVTRGTRDPNSGLWGLPPKPQPTPDLTPVHRQGAGVSAAQVCTHHPPVQSSRAEAQEQLGKTQCQSRLLQAALLDGPCRSPGPPSHTCVYFCCHLRPHSRHLSLTGVCSPSLSARLLAAPAPGSCPYSFPPRPEGQLCSRLPHSLSWLPTPPRLKAKLPH